MCKLQVQKTVEKFDSHRLHHLQKNIVHTNLADLITGLIDQLVDSAMDSTDWRLTCFLQIAWQSFA